MAAKTASTLTTLEWLLSSVNCHVVTETTAVGKLGGAKLTSKSLEVRLMASFVGIQTCTTGIVLATLITIVLSVLTMHCPLMIMQALFFLSVIRTLLTLEEHGALHMLLLHMSLQTIRSSIEETTHSADKLGLAPMFAVHMTDQAL